MAKVTIEKNDLTYHFGAIRRVKTVTVIFPNNVEEKGVKKYLGFDIPEGDLAFKLPLSDEAAARNFATEIEEATAEFLCTPRHAEPVIIASRPRPNRTPIRTWGDHYK